MPVKNICILGGGGFVGHHLVSQLAALGHRIVIPSRRRERVKDLLVLPTVEVVESDIHDPSELNRLFKGLDAVVNLVGILHGSKQDFVRAHVKLPHKVVAACRTAGVHRLLHMSALGADHNARSFYQHTKGEGERLVLEPSQGGALNVTVFRPSVIFGPGDSFLSLFADLLGTAPIVPLAGAQARFQPVHVADVANAFTLALDDPATFAQAYNLCGPKVYTLLELVELVAKTLGMRRHIIPLGKESSYLLAWLMEFKPGSKIMTRDNFYAMEVDNVCPAGFPTKFGAPRALEASLGYLQDRDHRRCYDIFRYHAGR